MAKTLPSNARAGLCSIMPGQGAKILHALAPKKTQNMKQKQFVMNSVKTLKIVHVKNNF